MRKNEHFNSTRPGIGQLKIASLVPEKKIGEGALGTVYLVRSPEQGTFVLKKYGHSDAAKIAYDNYVRAKEAGLDTIDLVRLDVDSNSLLLTDLTNDGARECCGATQKIKNSPKLTVTDIDKLIEKLRVNAEKASQADLQCPPDAILFIIEGDVLIDLCVGDFDYVQKVQEESRGLFNDNLDDVLLALGMFLVRNVDNFDTYKQKLSNAYKQYAHSA